jgi:hypothetical protein
MWPTYRFWCATRRASARRDGVKRDRAKALYGLVIDLASRLGRYRLAHLLASIPDSNDDFAID